LSVIASHLVALRRKVRDAGIRKPSCPEIAGGKDG
jgi:hypothetical protein